MAHMVAVTPASLRETGRSAHPVFGQQDRHSPTQSLRNALVTRDRDAAADLRDRLNDSLMLGSWRHDQHP